MAAAAPAAPLPARGGQLSRAAGTAGWVLVSVVAAAGAGLLAATHDRLFVDLVLAAVAAIGIRLFPFPVLLIVLLVAPKHSRFAELWFTCGAGLIVLWRMPFAAGRAFLFPLGTFLLLALPLVAWHSGLQPGDAGAVLTIPAVHFGYLNTPSVEGSEWLRLAFVLLVALLAALEVRTIRRLHVVAGAALLAGIYPMVTGVKQLVGGDFVAKGDFSAVRGSFQFPNELAIYLVFFLLLATVALFELRSRLLRFVVLVLSGVALLLLLHSYTRAAWIGFALGLALLAVVRYRALIAVALVALVIASIGFPSAVNSVQARFGDLASQNAANSKNSLKWRRGQWKAMWHFGTEKPLTGQGLGAYRRLTIKEFGLEGRTYGTVQDADGSGRLSLGFTAHNDFVKSWVETGALGLLLWVGTLAGIGYTLLRALRLPEVGPWAAGCLSTLVAFVLMSLSDNIQAYTVPLVYLFGLAGAVAGAAKAVRISSARRASS